MTYTVHRHPAPAAPTGRTRLRRAVRSAAARAALATVALLALVAGCGRASATDGRFHGLEVEPARAKPAFTLTATDGRPFDFRRETDGRVTLLFFGYTHCPDICPVHLTNLAAALDRLSPEVRDRIRTVFVTADPARDSLPRLREWLDGFDATFVGLRGERAELNRIEAELGIASSFADPAGGPDSSYIVGHAAQILAFSPDDSLRVIYPFGVRQQQWVEDLPKLARIGRR